MDERIGKIYNGDKQNRSASYDARLSFTKLITIRLYELTDLQQVKQYHKWVSSLRAFYNLVMPYCEKDITKLGEQIDRQYSKIFFLSGEKRQNFWMIVDQELNKLTREIVFSARELLLKTMDSSDEDIESTDFFGGM